MLVLVILLGQCCLAFGSLIGLNGRLQIIARGPGLQLELLLYLADLLTGDFPVHFGLFYFVLRSVIGKNAPVERHTEKIMAVSLLKFTKSPCEPVSRAVRPCPAAAARSRHRALHVVPLLEPEQPDAERLEVRAFTTLQRHTGRSLQPRRDEFAGVLDARIRRVTHDDARCLETVSRHAREAARLEQRAHLGAELDLFRTHLVEPVVACF